MILTDKDVKLLGRAAVNAAMRRFESLELLPMRRDPDTGDEREYDSEDSSTAAPDFWTVVGRLTTGALETICECETQEMAEYLYAVLLTLVYRHRSSGAGRRARLELC
jgi:hypothetical protein